MMRGLLRKTLLETWVLLLLFALALLTVVSLLTMLLPQLERGIQHVMIVLPMVRKFIQGLVGNSIGPRLDAQTLQSIIWVHPTVLALVWAHEIVFCTRVPAGEIDRGTIDILLSWPVSRRKVFLAETIVWFLSGLLLMLIMLCAHLIARRYAQLSAPVSVPRLLEVLANLLSIYVAVGGIAFLVSAVSDRRGRAMGVVFAILLASFLLNFLAQFWEATEVLAPLGVLNYYRPAEILSTGEFPWKNVGTLWLVGAVTWVAGLEIFARRNIATL